MAVAMIANRIHMAPKTTQTCIMILAYLFSFGKIYKGNAFRSWRYAGGLFFLPCPCTLEEAFATQHILSQTLFAHRLDDLRLGGDGCVVGAGEPKRAEAAHALVADEDVL